LDIKNYTNLPSHFFSIFWQQEICVIIALLFTYIYIIFGFPEVVNIDIVKQENSTIIKN